MKFTTPTPKYLQKQQQGGQFRWVELPKVQMGMFAPSHLPTPPHHFLHINVYPLCSLFLPVLLLCYCCSTGFAATPLPLLPSPPLTTIMLVIAVAWTMPSLEKCVWLHKGSRGAALLGNAVF